jgi:hypothetical protein
VSRLAVVAHFAGIHAVGCAAADPDRDSPRRVARRLHGRPAGRREGRSVAARWTIEMYSSAAALCHCPACQSPMQPQILLAAYRLVRVSASHICRRSQQPRSCDARLTTDRSDPPRWEGHQRCPDAAPAGCSSTSSSRDRALRLRHRRGPRPCAACSRPATLCDGLARITEPRPSSAPAHSGAGCGPARPGNGLAILSAVNPSAMAYRHVRHRAAAGIVTREQCSPAS